jgi:hypothetical protein
MRFTQGPRRRWLLLGLAVLLVAAFAVPALAQSSEDATDPSETTDQDTGDTRYDELQADFAEALAAELNLPTERVEDALANVREQFLSERREHHRERLQERLDEAVAAGALTQEQADAIAEAAEAGVLGRDGRRGFRDHGGFRGHDGHHGFGGGWDDGAIDDATSSEDAA